MIEYRVRPIKRYEVTRFSDANPHIGVSTVASNLTASEANDIAVAMHERANSLGMDAQALFSDGDALSNQ
ncbi:MAG TPA: hypothetical protein VFM75_12795 [Modicisalibacter sp.]|nr:hypothetical protein [Modicisalibacter sp.]